MASTATGLAGTWRRRRSGRVAKTSIHQTARLIQLGGLIADNQNRTRHDLAIQMRTLPIFLAFFLMGLADAMGPNADRVKNAYQLSNVMSTMLPFVVFIAFAVFSVPGGLLAARIGKKKVLLLGLGINALALIIPSLQAPSFPILLACIFSLGVGTTFLQVAGNPIMRDVSAAGTYSRNLAFAQGIKGIGSTASAYLVTAITTLALFKGMDWRGAFPLNKANVVMAVTR